MKSSPFVIDGIMTRTYSDNRCRSSATISCRPPKVSGSRSKLSATIVVNGENYIKTGGRGETIVTGVTCYNGIWQIADPPLNVTTFECKLGDPV
uniref:C6 domain-containing protein n=1 Tax=Panagrolaimus sp. ES5 TaxID=591445 RepID=A0AC34F4K9_9BILA